jgi:hypothetical protein
MARTDAMRAFTLCEAWRLARIGLADDPDKLLDRVGASPPISRIARPLKGAVIAETQEASSPAAFAREQ